MATITRLAFDEILDAFTTRAHGMVWCNVATVDASDRPASRILHPIWEGGTGWIGTRRESPKARDIAAHPFVSLAYVSDIARPVYADCHAEWADELADRQRAWDLFKATPEPLGYDPGPIFGDVAGFGLLKLTPWRIIVTDFPGGSLVWEAR